MKRRILLIALVAASGGVIANMRKEDLFGARPKPGPAPATVEANAAASDPIQASPLADVDSAGRIPDSPVVGSGEPPSDVAGSTAATSSATASEDAAHERILEALSESPLGRSLAPHSLADESSSSIPQPPSAEQPPPETASSKSKPRGDGLDDDANDEAMTARAAEPSVTRRESTGTARRKVDYDGVEIHLKDARRKTDP